MTKATVSSYSRYLSALPTRISLRRAVLSNDKTLGKTGVSRRRKASGLLVDEPVTFVAVGDSGAARSGDAPSCDSRYRCRLPWVRENSKNNTKQCERKKTDLGRPRRPPRPRAPRRAAGHPAANASVRGSRARQTTSPQSPVNQNARGFQPIPESKNPPKEPSPARCAMPKRATCSPRGGGCTDFPFALHWAWRPSRLRISRARKLLPLNPAPRKPKRPCAGRRSAAASSRRR